MPKTLLLADDSATIQRVIELTFAQEDVRVVSVSDGRLAVEWLEGECPDIVLADVDVPEVDGYRIAAHMHSSDRLTHVPVLLLAGAFEPVDHARVDAAGCDGVLVKPFEPQQLVTRVKELLDRVALPALTEVAGGEVDSRGGQHDLASVMPFPVRSGRVDGGGGTEPEPLEPPSRSVWEIGGPEHPAVDPAAAAPAQPGPKVSLVSAFSALLAAEQTSAPTATAHAAPVTEATVEDAVRRVLVRMTDELVRRIVVETAERLIREEIEKIKANPE